MSSEDIGEYFCGKMKMIFELLLVVKGKTRPVLQLLAKNAEKAQPGMIVINVGPVGQRRSLLINIGDVWLPSTSCNSTSLY